jgi:hypothetical protein
VNTANWDLQGHAASQGKVVALGAAFSVPGGLGVVDGDEIPVPGMGAGEEERERAAWLTRDPEIKCYMPGVPRATYMPYPFQIVQTPANVLFAYEFASASRIVYMNSTDESPAESWMGFSRGRWDGDTLVIDVTSFNEDTWFDRAGNFHSADLHVVERYTRTGPTSCIRGDDRGSEGVHAPVDHRMPLYRRLEKNAQLLEYKCVEFVEELMYGHPAQEGPA